MKAMMLQLGIKLLFSVLNPELAAKLYDRLIAKISAYVASTPYTIDDIIWATIQKGGAVMQDIGDTILDFAESYVLGTSSKVDDAIVLPMCEIIRATLNMPDDD